MHVHPALVSASLGVFSALAGSGRHHVQTALAPDTPVAWIGGPPTDDDARTVREALGGQAAGRYAAVLEAVAERLFRQDQAGVGATADIGFFWPFYLARARDVLGRLDGQLVRIGAGR